MENISKNKFKTALTFFGSAALSVMAFAFVCAHWELLNNFGTPVSSRNAALFPPRSDAQSERGEGTAMSDGERLGYGDLSSIETAETAGVSAPGNGSDNPVNSANNNSGEHSEPEKPVSPNIILSQEEVRFKTDEAVFLDPESAESALSEYADNLRQHIEDSDENVKVYIVGCVAKTADLSGSQELSEKRGLAVLDALIKYGVPERSVSAFRMGFNDPWHLEDFDENGVRVNDNAAANRKVVIVMSGDGAMSVLRTKIADNGAALTVFYYENGVLTTRESADFE
jgi:outer membrane protein OmpA-like peptidoglycan-associated protein